MKINTKCTCKEPDFAVVNNIVFPGHKDLVSKYWYLIGTYICSGCGAIMDDIGDQSYHSLTGGSVINLALKRGFIK